MKKPAAPRRGGMLGGAMFGAGAGPSRVQPPQGYPPSWSMLQGRMSGGAQALPPGVRVPMPGPLPPPPAPPPQAQGLPQTGGALRPALLPPGDPGTAAAPGMGIPAGMPPPDAGGGGMPPTGGPLQAALMSPPGMGPRPPRQPMPFG